MKASQIAPYNTAQTALERRIESLREEHRANTEAALSANTRRNYECQWRRFVQWCRDAGQPCEPPVADAVVLAYATELGAAGKSMSTINLALGAIARAHAVRDLPAPTRGASLKDSLRGLRNRRAHARTHAVRQASSLTPAHLRAIVGGADDRSEAIQARDAALVLMGFAGGFRRAELVALDASDIVDQGDGLAVYIYRSKTDQEGAGATIVIPCAVDLAICPVRAWRRWLALFTPRKAAFVAVHRSGAIQPGARISPVAVARAVAAAMRRIGVEEGKWSGHSLRRGFVTTAVVHHVPLLDIAEHVRHARIDTTRGYIDKTDQRRHSKLRGLF